MNRPAHKHTGEGCAFMSRDGRTESLLASARACSLAVNPKKFQLCAFKSPSRSSHVNVNVRTQTEEQPNADDI